MTLRSLPSRFCFGWGYPDAPEHVKLTMVRRAYIALFCVTIVAMAAFGAVFWLGYRLSFPADYGSPTLNFTDLSGDEEQHVLDVLADMNPIYLRAQHSMTFAHNITPYLEESGSHDAKENDLTLGFNQMPAADIYVRYTDDDYTLRMVICHESLHSFVGKNEISHRVIYDLGNKLVCYKTKRR